MFVHRSLFSSDPLQWIYLAAQVGLGQFKVLVWEEKKTQYPQPNLVFYLLLSPFRIALDSALANSSWLEVEWTFPSEESMY